LPATAWLVFGAVLVGEFDVVDAFEVFGGELDR
jgi:hypothetical protein